MSKRAPFLLIVRLLLLCAVGFLAQEVAAECSYFNSSLLPEPCSTIFKDNQYAFLPAEQIPIRYETLAANLAALNTIPVLECREILYPWVCFERSVIGFPQCIQYEDPFTGMQMSRW
jgi:hypothetical protein